jgi:membrane protein DedA with SNARE-associated domain
VVAALGTLANALAPALAARHPLLLIALDARNRFLLLARHVDLVPFVVVGTLRRLSSDPLYFLLGRWYGDGAVRWMERKAGGGAFVRLTERVFARASYPMVFLFPGAVPCTLAGATGMSAAAFLALNLSGTVAAVVALRLSADLLAAPVDAVLRFFDRHLVVTTAISIALVVLSIVVGRLEGKAEYSMGDLEELERTGDELDEVGDEDRVDQEDTRPER